MKTWLTLLTVAVAVLGWQAYRTRWTASLKPDALDSLTIVDYDRHYDYGRKEAR